MPATKRILGESISYQRPIAFQLEIIQSVTMNYEKCIKKTDTYSVQSWLEDDIPECYLDILSMLELAT
mgnify:CR=1 FL=1